MTQLKNSPICIHSFRVHPMVLALTAALALGGCGGGGGGGGGNDDNAAGANTKSGALLSSYISNALVYCDTGRDGLFADEESTTSDENGNFTFANACSGNSQIVAESQAGSMARHKLADGTFKDMEFSGTLKAPLGLATVSPLTTMISAMIAEGMDIKAATSQLVAALGLTAGTSLDVDINLPEFAAVLAVSESFNVLLKSGVDLSALAAFMQSNAGELLVNADGTISGAAMESAGVSAEIQTAISKLASTYSKAAADPSILANALAAGNDFLTAIKNGDEAKLIGLDEFTTQVDSMASATAPVAINSSVSTGSGMIVTGKLSGFDPNGGSLTFSKSGFSSAVIKPDGTYTYTAPSFGTSGSFAFIATDAAGVASAPGTVTVFVSPYLDMGNVSLNNAAPVSLPTFSDTGISAGSSGGIETVSFSLADRGGALTTSKSAKVAMKFTQGSEELSVSLENVDLSKDSSGIHVSYPLNAHMYGFYTNGTQTSAADLANVNSDMLKTINGGASFDTLSVQLKTMASKFEDTFVSDSPLIAGTASGTYTATFVIDGVLVGGSNKLQGEESITIRKPGGGEYSTVTGNGITGTVNF